MVPFPAALSDDESDPSPLRPLRAEPWRIRRAEGRGVGHGAGVRGGELPKAKERDVVESGRTGAGGAVQLRWRSGEWRRRSRCGHMGRKKRWLELAT